MSEHSFLPSRTWLTPCWQPRSPWEEQRMGMETLLFCLFLLRSPLFPNMHLVHILLDHFHLGPEAYEVLCRLTTITASLGISEFVIFFWRTILAVKPPIFQVNLKQISEKISNFVKDNRQLAENIANMEQKILEKENSTEDMKDAILANTSGISECESAFNEACVSEVEVTPEELHEQNVQLNTEKNQLQDASAELENLELRALRNKNCQLVEDKKNLKDICDTLRSVKAEKEVELKMLKRKEAFLVEFYEQRKMAAEEKLKKKQCEWMEKENQLSAAEGNLKLVSAEAHNYKQQIEQMQEELQQEEVSFRHQISLLEKKAQDNWIKGRILEREMAEQSREAAYLRHKSVWMQEGAFLSHDHPACPTPWAALYHHSRAVGLFHLLHPGFLWDPTQCLHIFKMENQFKFEEDFEP
ncbi:transport and Golgi organization protein 1 homolog isoform X2 [Bos javanicus]|uniref:transport and Golgi organization protein 1 homolog isoform X2 n=1 Tax=Bos javanicus TaxID=9906 RepID=UPI002AA5E82B|nr:transport and Golgi organization protein 1 homolog isoform X2 [Bos javanicus]